MLSRACLQNSTHILVDNEASTEFSELDLAQSKVISLEAHGELPLLKNQSKSTLRACKAHMDIDKIDPCLMS